MSRGRSTPSYGSCGSAKSVVRRTSLRIVDFKPLRSLSLYPVPLDFRAKIDRIPTMLNRCAPTMFVMFFQVSSVRWKCST